MKILMIGRGVIATVYGWALTKAGHSITYYVRPGRAALYGPEVTLDLLDVRRRVQGVWVQETLSTALIEDLPAGHDHDLIMVSVQHYRFPEVVDFLAQRPSQATVLLFSNLWTELDEAVAALNAEHLVWGFPGAGGSFGADGVLTGVLMKTVMIGSPGSEVPAGATPPPSPREQAVRELFRSSGFGIKVQRDYPGWVWGHFLTNVGLLSQALTAGSFARMMASDAHLREAVLNIRELLPLLAARGVDLRRHTADLALFRLPPGVVAGLMRLAPQLHAPARRTIQVALAGDGELEREVTPMALDALAEARRLGVVVPRLEAFVAQLSREPAPVPATALEAASVLG